MACLTIFRVLFCLVHNLGLHFCEWRRFPSSSPLHRPQQSHWCPFQPSGHQNATSNLLSSWLHRMMIEKVFLILTRFRFLVHACLSFYMFWHLCYLCLWYEMWKKEGGGWYLKVLFLEDDGGRGRWDWRHSQVAGGGSVMARACFLVFVSLALNV